MKGKYQDHISLSPQAARSRVVRIFISSTFRDMQLERDELARSVYPRLRAFCRERQVDFVEVDLRWGITAEQADRNETLDICMDEIDRCRPYFIGLLGERYGWIPETVPAETVTRFPWLAGQAGASVTQLEICHGVLNNPSLARHAFFYFRDSGYTLELSGPDPEAFAAESPQAEERLLALKDRIRACGLPVVENYTNPAALSERVLADLLAAVEADFPRSDIPDALELEKAGHMAFALDRARVYIPRESDFRRLDSYVHSRDPVPLLVTGESGSGKSALLANWALGHLSRCPKSFLFLHFTGSTPASADPAAILRRLLHELKREFSIPNEIPDSFDELQRALPNFLSMAARSKRKIILILDGINQLEDRGNARRLPWLPESFPANVRVVVSALPGPGMEALRTRSVMELQVLPLTPSERGTLMDRYLSRYSKRLDGGQKQLILESSLTCTPLYLRTLLDELRRLGRYDCLEERIRYYLEAGDIPSLFIKVLKRMEGDYAPEGYRLVQETLSFIGCARQGLTESELIELQGNPPRIFWSPFYAALGELTVLHSGLLSFAHDYLRQAVEARYLEGLNLRGTLTERLADYFGSKPLDTRKLEELPWLLARLGQWPRLYALLSQPDFFLPLWERDRYEAKNYWAQIEARSDLRKSDAYRPVLRHPGNYDIPFLNCIATLFTDTGCTGEAGKLWNHIIRRCRTTGDEEGLQKALGFRGNLLFSRGDLKGAWTAYRRKEELCRRLENGMDLQSALGNQGLILFRQGKPHRAMARYHEAEGICLGLGFSDGLLVALGNQGNILYCLGDPDAALEKYIKQEKICRRTGNLVGLKTSLGCQGVIFYNRGDLERALELFGKQEEICRNLGDADGLSVCLGNRANILFDCGDVEEALILQKEKADICRRTGNLQGLQIALGNLGRILEHLKRPEEALVQFSGQETLCRKLTAVDDLAASLFDQARILKQLRRYTRSREKAEEALAVALQHGFGPLSAKIQSILADLPSGTD